LSAWCCHWHHTVMDWNFHVWILAYQFIPYSSIQPSVCKYFSVTVYVSVSPQAILEPFSKVLSYSIENCVMKYHYLVDLCYLCSRGFTRVSCKGS